MCIQNKNNLRNLTVHPADYVVTPPKLVEQQHYPKLVAAEVHLLLNIDLCWPLDVNNLNSQHLSHSDPWHFCNTISPSRWIPECLKLHVLMCSLETLSCLRSALLPYSKKAPHWLQALCSHCACIGFLLKG